MIIADITHQEVACAVSESAQKWRGAPVGAHHVHGQVLLHLPHQGQVGHPLVVTQHVALADTVQVLQVKYVGVCIYVIVGVYTHTEQFPSYIWEWTDSCQWISGG